jgi:hypothetical protein
MDSDSLNTLFSVSSTLYMYSLLKNVIFDVHYKKTVKLKELCISNVNIFHLHFVFLGKIRGCVKKLVQKSIETLNMILINSFMIINSVKHTTKKTYARKKTKKQTLCQPSKTWQVGIKLQQKQLFQIKFFEIRPKNAISTIFLIKMSFLTDIEWQILTVEYIIFSLIWSKNDCQY